MSDVPKSKSKSKEKKSTKSIEKKKRSSKVLKTKEKSTLSNIETSEMGDKNTTSNQETQNQMNYYDQMKIQQNAIGGNNNSMKEKCEGCFEADGIVYCANCGKIYCKTCEDQIHIVPANRLHERRPLNDMTYLRKLCYHHNNPLKYFCESCEEPICQECQMIGPHNNKLHKIITIFESYQKKYSYLSEIINKNIVQKYEQTMSQISYLNYISEQVKKVKNGIEREIRSEYAEMIEELRTVEGKKLAVLNYESSILQKDVNKMQDIMTYVNELGGNESPDMISFLLRYKQLNEMVEFALAKPINTKIEITLDDFPKRVEENKRKLERVNKYEKLLKLKDDIIWKIVNEHKANKNCSISSNEKEINEIKEKSKNEIEAWAKLSDKDALELQKYNLVCNFCGCYLDEVTVNSSCDKNMEKEQNSMFAYGKGIVPEEIKGTGRHFFSSPLKDNDEYGRKSNPFDKNIFNETNYKSHDSLPNHEWMIEFISELMKQKDSFINVLHECDSDHDTYLTMNEFNESIKKMGFTISQYEIEYLLTGLVMTNKDRIGINDIIKNMENILIE